MTTDRIKEIQSKTAYPDSISVQQALLKVWNECEQEQKQVKNLNIPVVVGQSEQLKCGVLGGVCPYETGDRLCRAEFKCENQVAF